MIGLADKPAHARRARTVRSFVTRAGRVTAGQQRALAKLWPRFGVEFAAQLVNLDELFGRAARRVMEIGFGNGEHLSALARAHPECDYLGVEVHRPGVGHLLLALEAHALTNVRIVCHDVVEVLEQQITSRALDEVIILFPDPWPKTRHHKRRLIQPPFVALLCERLQAGGVLRLTTDWQPYAEQMLEVLDAEPRLVNVALSERFMPRPAERLRTRFERRGERLGHGVWDLAYRLI